MSWLENTRTSYDIVAESYQPMVWAMFDDILIERSMLTLFAALVPDGRVADIGCGPGDITAVLADLGLDIIGIDLSPGMLAVARRNHPSLEFHEGDMTALPLREESLAGVISWWSTVHLPVDVVPVVLAECARVLSPGGHLLVGFHAGDEVRHKTEGYGGHPVTLDVYLRKPAAIIDAATSAGLLLVANLTVSGTARTGPPGADQCCLLFRQQTKQPKALK